MDLQTVYDSAINGQWNQAFDQFKQYEASQGDGIDYILDDDSISEAFKLQLLASFLYRVEV